MYKRSIKQLLKHPINKHSKCNDDNIFRVIDTDVSVDLKMSRMNSRPISAYQPISSAISLKPKGLELPKAEV